MSLLLLSILALAGVACVVKPNQPRNTDDEMDE